MLCVSGTTEIHIHTGTTFAPLPQRYSYLRRQSAQAETNMLYSLREPYASLVSYTTHSNGNYKRREPVRQPARSGLCGLLPKALGD